MKLLTVAAVLPALRLLIDAGDAVAELAHRCGLSDLAATRTVGGWDLEADVDLHRFGAGVLVEHLPPLTPLGQDWFTAGVVVGPLLLSATRRRDATERLDCALGGPLGESEAYFRECLERGESAPQPDPRRAL